MTRGDPLLCVQNLTKTFAGCNGPVIETVSFCVHEGEVVALVGPSGCGKTTKLRCIMGFERADSGSVKHGETVLQDQSTFISPEYRDVGFVFQDYALFPHLTAIRNVMFGVRAGSRKEKIRIAKEALWKVGLTGLENRRPHDLSGGQQQRVALARAMAPGHKVILLDEPFCSLDTDLRHAIRNEVRTLAAQANLGIVLVTHDQEEALCSADQLAVMRQGRIEQIGLPEEVYNYPQTAFVAQFLGRTNLVNANARGNVADTPLGEVKLERSAVGHVRLSIRPEHLELSASTVKNAAVIVGREFKGHDLTYTVRHGNTSYIVQTDHTCCFNIGDRVTLHLRAAAAIIEDRQRVQLGGIVRK